MVKMTEKGYNITIRKGSLEQKIHVSPGTGLWPILQKSGLQLPGECSGNHTCGKCRIQLSAQGEVEFGWGEKDLLGEQEVRKGTRLACFIEVNQDLGVTLPEDRMANILLEGYSQGDKQESGLQEERALKGKSALKDRALGKDNQVYGLAVDLGTTTLAVYLVNMSKGTVVDSCGSLNPQRSYGLDVITRIQHTLQAPPMIKEFQSLVCTGLNRIISDLAGRNKVAMKEIRAMTVVGNPTMLHLFLGISCASMARAPFLPSFTDSRTVLARELGLAINPLGRILVYPSISGYVGGDTLAAVLASGMGEEESLSLLIDLGTNGEIVLGNKTGLLSCSVAAGPAFEGMQLSCGTGGVEGAIDNVNLEQSPPYTTIGGKTPMGLCGSGIVSVVAELLKHGILEPSGRLKKGEEIQSFRGNQLLDGLICRNGQGAFLLAEKADIYITQKDIRELQLAKGAVAAGINILLSELGVIAGQVERVYLAGGFGSSIREEHLISLKVLSTEFKGKTKSLGNAAGQGAILGLCSEEAFNKVENLKDKTTYLELAGLPKFQEVFVENLAF